MSNRTIERPADKFVPVGWTVVTPDDFSTFTQYAERGELANLLNAGLQLSNEPPFGIPSSEEARFLLGSGLESLAALAAIGEKQEGMDVAEFVLPLNLLRDWIGTAVFDPVMREVLDADHYISANAVGRSKQYHGFGSLAASLMDAVLTVGRWSASPCPSIRSFRLFSCAPSGSTGCAGQEILTIRDMRGRLSVTSPLAPVPHVAKALNRLWVGTSSVDEARVCRSLSAMCRYGTGCEEAIAA